jgi:uncharacterized membrane protein
MMSLMKLLHLLAIVVWVGGMFFAYVVLRPSAAEILQAPERLRLWDSVFKSFFNWVWLAIFLVLLSGFYMIYLFGGISSLPMYINLMLALGLVMTGIYVYVYFKCYAQFTRLVGNKSWPEAGAFLGTIRKLVGLNLSLGMLVIVVATIGRAL